MAVNRFRRPGEAAIIAGNPDERAAERHEGRPDRRGLHELATVPRLLQLGVAIEIGSASVAHEVSLRRQRSSIERMQPVIVGTLYLPRWLRVNIETG